MRLYKHGDGEVGVKVDSIESHGQFYNIYPLDSLFLGGVPKDFDAKPVPVSRFAASLFNVPCHSVDQITGGGGRGGVGDKPIGWAIYDPR